MNNLILEDFLPYRLSVLSNTVSAAMAEAYSDHFGLSIAEWRILAVLGRFPGISAGEVAARTAMDKVAVSRAVARLTSAGRIRREFADADRRRSMLELTADGERIFTRLTPVLLKYEQALLDDLPASDRKRLAGVLEQLLQRARALGPPALEDEAEDA
jgi:DNA-binding MarR family transcriptional regulator